MIIKITDIPQGGRELDFKLDGTQLTQRAGLKGKQGGNSPEYVFPQDAQASIKLCLEGSSVIVSGEVRGSYKTPCSRCIEEVQCDFEVPLQINLKPKTNFDPRYDIEDINFGFYDGREVDCTAFSEEFVLLSLPYSVLCNESCKGLCHTCGTNLNTDACSCASTRTASKSPWSALKDIKIV